MAAAFCDKLMSYDVDPEDWRKLDVAESPDEEALVAGAADLGMAFRGRSTEGVTLDAFDRERTYEVLVTLPFDSHMAGFSLAGLFDCKRAEQQV